MENNIKLKITKTQLVAINKIWNYVDFIDDTTAEGKAIVSMAKKLAVKFSKKYATIRFKVDKASKQYSISLEYFEGYFLELLIRRCLEVFPYGYEKQVIQNIADFLNQKLA